MSTYNDGNMFQTSNTGTPTNSHSANLMPHTENTHREGCSISNIPLAFASCTCSVVHTENTTEELMDRILKNLYDKNPYRYRPIGVNGDDGLTNVMVAILNYAEARVREEMKKKIEEIKEMTLDIQPLPEDAKTYMGDFERGTVGGGYYVKESILEILTPKDTK